MAELRGVRRVDSHGNLAPSRTVPVGNTSPQEGPGMEELDYERDREVTELDETIGVEEELDVDAGAEDVEEEDTADGDKITFIKSLRVKRKKLMIYKNVVIVCIAFLMTFTAFQSMQNLQSSLNRLVGLGTISLSVIYGTMVISCLFLAPWLISRCGCKWTLTVSLVPYALFMAANFHPTWFTLVPAAALLGVSAAPLWTAKCTYLTRAGEAFAELSNDSSSAVVNRFFGIFFMAFQSAQIWGSLISSFILLEQPEGGGLPGLATVSRQQLAKCGALYCSEDQQLNNTNLVRPDVIKVYTLSGTYTCLCVLAVLTTALCLDGEDKLLPATDSGNQETGNRSKSRRQAANSSGDDGRVRRGGCDCSIFLATVRRWKNKDQLMLIPLTVYSGLEQAFFASDFTKSFVSCSLGIWMVGMIIVCYGVTAAVCSCLCGRLVKHTGRCPLFVIAALGNCGVLLTLFLWQPRPEGLAMFFVVSAVWGLCDGIWQTLINGLYGCVFAAHKESAFANYRLWEAAGFITAFSYSHFLCVYVKIYILLATLTLGMMGYFAVETRRRDRKLT